MTFRRAVLSFMLFFLVVPMGVALVPERANAAAFGLVPCALKENDNTTSWDERAPCTLCHFMIGFQRIISLLRNIMTAIAIAVIVAMAIVYITSAGDEGRMSFAKEGIKWSLIGFAVILLAWVIVNFLFTLPIFANNGLVRTGWDTLSCNTTSQVGWTAGTSKVSSSIGNASGAASNAPNRYGLPGATPGTGGTGGAGGTGGGGTGGGGTGGGGTVAPKPRCGGAHYSCSVGTASDTQQLSDRWTWVCKEGSYQQFCLEKFEGCGDGKVSGMNQYGEPEVCDQGGANGLCHSGDDRITCDMNYCKPCNGVVPPVVPFGCGASHGSTSNSPPTQLCNGEGAIASSVTSSAVGSGTRYDWTCSRADLYGVLSCYSGRTSDTGGNTTATCGPAAGVPSTTQPQNVDLCVSPGYLDMYGVTAGNHAVTGEPLWFWGCQTTSGGAQTSCTAPRTSGGSSSSGGCSSGTYDWSVNGVQCNSSYISLNNGNATQITDNDGGTWGTAGIQCVNGGIVPSTLFGSNTCNVTTSGAACGELQAIRGSGGGIAPVSESFCSQGYADAVSCTTSSNSIGCTWLCRAQSGGSSASCSGNAVPN